MPRATRSSDEGVPVTLALSAPAGCIDLGVLGARVRDVLGRDPFVEEAAADALAVDVQAGPTAEGAEARIVVRLAGRDDVVGERTLSVVSAGDASTRCAALARPLALVVGMLVDVPRDELERLVLASDHAAEAQPREAPARPSPASLTLRVALGGGVVAGWTPGLDGRAEGVVPVGALAGSVAFGDFELELGALGLPSTRMEGSGGGAVDLGGALGVLTACGLPLALGPRVDVGVCASLGAGIYVAEGQGLAEVSTAVRGQALLGVALRGRAVLVTPEDFFGASLALRLDVGLDAPLLHDRFRLAPDGTYATVFTASSIAPRALLALEVGLDR